MPTKQWDAAAACTEKELIGAGGGDDQAGYLTTVEIMNTDTHQWFTADSLPHSLDYASFVVCEDHIYSLGGENYSNREPSQLVWRCSLAKLNETSRPVMTTQSVPQTVVARLKTVFGFRHDVPAVEMPMPDESKENMKRTLWQSTAKTPLFYSAYASVGGQLLAIGGTTEVNTNMSCQVNHGTYSADVFAYDPESNVWKATNQMLTPRSCCLATVLSKDTLLVVGGRTNGAVPYKALRDVEIATII